MFSNAAKNELTVTRSVVPAAVAVALAFGCSSASAGPTGYWPNPQAYRVVSVQFTASAHTVNFDSSTGAVAFKDSQTTKLQLRPPGTTTFGSNGDITVPISGETRGTQSSYYTEGSKTGSQTGVCSYRFEFKGSDSLQINFVRHQGSVQTSFIPVTNEGGYCTPTTEAEAPNWHLPNEVTVPSSRFSGDTIVLGTSGSYEAGKGSSLAHTKFTWSLTVKLARR
jgi:hypothetical protein